jgi:hypothetical protein
MVAVTMMGGGSVAGSRDAINVAAGAGDERARE